MANEGTDITTPLGRIVWGHPITPQNKTDQQTRQPVKNANGEVIQQWGFGLAIPKDQFAPVWAAMNAEAAKGYPNGVPGHFSWKIKDGDGIDRQGKPYNQRAGYAGCYVMQITTELKAPGTFVYENGAYRQLQPTELKTGDYVTCGLNLKVNVPTNPQHTPGLYINPTSVLLQFLGEKIENSFTADPTQVFGQQPQQIAMPAGAQPIGAGGLAGQMPPIGAGMPGNAPGAGMPNAPVVPAQPMMSAPGAPSSPPPPVAPAGPQRPTDPSHIHAAGTAQEQWWINGVWTPAPQQPTMPPPATDFIPGQPQQPMMPTMPGAPQMQPGQPGQMPGMPGPR
jgi:hypothetical protein